MVFVERAKPEVVEKAAAQMARVAAARCAVFEEHETTLADVLMCEDLIESFEDMDKKGALYVRYSKHSRDLMRRALTAFREKRLDDIEKMDREDVDVG